MNLYGISCALTAIVGLSMAVLVYIKGYKQRLVRIWSAFALSAAVYGFGAYMVTNVQSISGAFFWWQVAYTGVISLPFLFVYLVYEFLGIERPRVIKAMGLITFLFLLANIFFRKLFIANCTLYFKDMGWVKPIYFVYPAGPLLIFFIVFIFVGWVAYALFELIKNYSKTTGLKRNQAKYFLFAPALGFIGGGTSFLPCFGISLYPILNFTVPLYFLIMSYAILRYRLMDVKVAITRTGVFVVVYTLVLGSPFVLVNLGKGWLISFLGESWWLGPMTLITVLATVGPFLYIFLQRRAEAIFLREQKHYQKTLRETALEMTRIRNLQKLIDLLLNTFTNTVQISHCAIYLSDADSGNFIRKGGSDLKPGESSALGKDNKLATWLESHKEVLVAEEIKQEAQDDPHSALEEMIKQMQNLNAAVVVPSFLKDKLIGIMVLGGKRSGRIYSVEDLNIFSVLASQAALGIENASLYENMEEQVKRRTKELIDVQNQLTQAAKLATVGTLAGGVAHEINNPLAAILTNVQMLLSSLDEFDIEETKESLELIEEATRRCRTIVKKLMTYARKPMEAAAIVKNDLLKVVKKADAFLGYQLKQENIKVAIEAKDHAYFVMGNQNELEQVVTNMVLNAKDAIKRVKKSGTIHISLSKNENWMKLGIKDDGSGIPKDHIPKIFDPFFTTKDVGKGLGLGLSISHSIVEKYQGSIFLKTEENKGTTFTINLPSAE